MKHHTEHPDAGAELFAAAERYEQAQPGLGHALFAAVEVAIRAIDQFPDGWPPFPGWSRQPVVRSKGTARFSCRVVYFVQDGEPVILAYAHERQRPGYWADRFDDMLEG
ncbi:MAG: hypothetical protein LBU50_04975 [Cellulomonas sp.]|nr:hypothetical protein [Cellulomonas sp.]